MQISQGGVKPPAQAHTLLAPPLSLKKKKKRKKKWQKKKTKGFLASGIKNKKPEGLLFLGTDF